MIQGSVEIRKHDTVQIAPPSEYKGTIRAGQARVVSLGAIAGQPSYGVRYGNEPGDAPHR